MVGLACGYLRMDWVGFLLGRRVGVDEGARYLSASSLVGRVVVFMQWRSTAACLHASVLAPSVLICVLLLLVVACVFAILHGKQGQLVVVAQPP